MFTSCGLNDDDTHDAGGVEAVLALVAAHLRQVAGGGVQAAVAHVALRRALHVRADRRAPHLHRIQDCAVL